jgi:hypothetical protein
MGSGWRLPRPKSGARGLEAPPRPALPGAPPGLARREDPGRPDWESCASRASWGLLRQVARRGGTRAPAKRVWNDPAARPDPATLRNGPQPAQVGVVPDCGGGPARGERTPPRRSAEPPPAQGRVFGELPRPSHSADRPRDKVGLALVSALSRQRGYRFGPGHGDHVCFPSLKRGRLGPTPPELPERSGDMQ